MEIDERITESRNSVAPGLSPGRNNPIALHTDESSVYRVTSIDQIKDIIECGYVRPKGYGARREKVGDVIYWSQGNDKLYYFDKRPVIESSTDNVKNNQKGAISINKLTAIWIFDDEQNKYINRLDEIKKLHNQRFHQKYDNKKISLAELEPLLSETGYMCVGHGTGRSGNGDDIVDSIFEKGLRTKDNSLSLTSITLSTPTPELIQSHRELDIEIPTIDTVRNQLNNWEHFNSKRIIIAKIPSEYINRRGDSSDRDGEMYGAFFNEIEQKDGQIKYYLDSRYILGCYNVETQTFRINSKYEKALTDETKSKLKIGYLKALKKTEIRLSRSTIPLGKPINTQIVNSTPNYDLTASDYDEVIEWDSSEVNNNKSR